MELATTLTSQTVQNAVREVGINPNYWYPVGWASELKNSQVIPVTVWQQAIALPEGVKPLCPDRSKINSRSAFGSGFAPGKP